MFEAAITGRAALEGTEGTLGKYRGRSMIDLSAQTEEEMEAIRNAVVQQQGLLLSVLNVLRRVPRRVLMVLKLNDLTRSLDRALATTHANVSLRRAKSTRSVVGRLGLSLMMFVRCRYGSS